MGFFRALDARDLLAPTPVSRNVCLDEKLRFLSRRQGRGAALIAMGSSMTLNNLSSDAVMAALPAGWDYLNLGAWQVKPHDVWATLSAVLDVYRPRVFLSVIAPQDLYYYAAAPLDADEFEDILRDERGLLRFLRYFDLVYYVESSRHTIWARAHRDSYSSLAFDAHGGVNLDIRYPEVDPVRWNYMVGREPIDPAAYTYIGAFGAMLRAHHVKMVVVQPPIRGAALDDQGRAYLARHWSRMQWTVEQVAGRWLNLAEAVRDDAEFADYSHLNAAGAARFTKTLMAELGPELGP